MTESARLRATRRLYEAFAAGDRAAAEALLADDLTFSSPPDPRLDRAGYFARCWPHAGNGEAFDFTRLIEAGDAVVVTYEATRPDGTRYRNTEVLTFAGERIRRVEVYFGWEVS
jgi:ketosteroid isomerase-like protein